MQAQSEERHAAALEPLHLRDSQRRAEIKELKDEMVQLRESEGLSKLALAQIQKELDLLSLQAPKPSRQNTPTILVPKEVQEKDRQLKTMREELIGMDSAVLAAKAQAEQQQYEVDQLKAKLAAQLKQAASGDQGLRDKLSEYMQQNQRILKENALRRARVEDEKTLAQQTLADMQTKLRVSEQELTATRNGLGDAVSSKQVSAAAQALAERELYEKSKELMLLRQTAQGLVSAHTTALVLGATSMWSKM
jgi:hypothetical protein